MSQPAVASGLQTARGLASRQPPGLAARGLAVWVTAEDGAAIDEAVLARAAELVLARALKSAPEAEVHFRPAAGATTSAVGRPPGEETATEGTATEGTSDGGASRPAVNAPAPEATATSRLAVDLAAGEALVDGEPAPLSGLEFALLRHLVENCSRTISRQELQCRLESFDTPGAAARSIDVYVGRVRRKLGGARHAIITVRSGGYRFVPGPHATVRGPAEYSI
ncbi:winged helix-turn-helix domain-containing protein [Pseudarthrobacter sp. S9]|uniref:winged helix-turn-helix domain-containing protein n=1 Tax=Pseudarthrobacter sp. S9 TaxID=3418421 RepID=UPI003D04A78F